MSKHSALHQVTYIKNSYSYILSRLGVMQNPNFLENAQTAIKKIEQKFATSLPATIATKPEKSIMTQNTQLSVESSKLAKNIYFQD